MTKRQREEVDLEHSSSDTENLCDSRDLKLCLLEVKKNYRFEIDKDDFSRKYKVAICLICDKNGKKRKVSMKDSCTSGIKRHLYNKHKEEYVRIYGRNMDNNNNRQVLPLGSQQIDSFFVS